MRMLEIAVSRTVRVNTGNYEGTEHFVSARVEVDELDDEQSAMAELSAKVDRAMVTQLHRAYAVRGKKDMTRRKIARHHGLATGED